MYPKLKRIFFHNQAEKIFPPEICAFPFQFLLFFNIISHTIFINFTMHTIIHTVVQNKAFDYIHEGYITDTFLLVWIQNGGY